MQHNTDTFKNIALIINAAYMHSELRHMRNTFHDLVLDGHTEYYAPMKEICDTLDTCYTVFETLTGAQQQ